jgi:hypothetical protein
MRIRFKLRKGLSLSKPSSIGATFEKLLKSLFNPSPFDFGGIISLHQKRLWKFYTKDAVRRTGASLQSESRL